MEQPRLEVRPKSADLPKSCQFPGMISKPKLRQNGVFGLLPRRGCKVAKRYAWSLKSEDSLGLHGSGEVSYLGAVSVSSTDTHPATGQIAPCSLTGCASGGLEMVE